MDRGIVEDAFNPLHDFVCQQGHDFSSLEVFFQLAGLGGTEQYSGDPRVFEAPGQGEFGEAGSQIASELTQSGHFFEVGIGEQAGRPSTVSSSLLRRTSSGVPPLYFPVRIPDANGLQMVVPKPTVR